MQLGQHLASTAVIPVEWSETMSVLQDRCPPSAMQDIDDMLLTDTGKSRELYCASSLRPTLRPAREIFKG